jgi:hypothetical protein
VTRAGRAIALVLLAVVVSSATAAAPEPFRGLPLSTALARLQQQGLPIIFSTELVT